MGSDRCGIAQDVNHPIAGVPAAKITAEWCQEGIASSFDCTPELNLTIPWQNLPELHEKLLQAEVANYLVSDLSEFNRNLFMTQGIASCLFVPIIVNGIGWGQIGFDNCGEPKLFDEAEIVILKVAADSIAAAIERQQKDEALRQSEALYRSLFEISNEGIYRVEYNPPIPLHLSVERQIEQVYRSFHLAQANDALAAMYGLVQGEEMVGTQLAEFNVDNPETTLSFVRSVVESKYQFRNMEREEISFDRQRHYFLNSVIGFIEGDCVTGGWGIQIDITDLRQAQQALLAAEQERTKLLTTITAVANQLLRAAEYTTVLLDVLGMLGEAANADRCGLIQNVTHPHTGKPAAQMHTEWCRDRIQPSIVHTPDLKSAFAWELFADGYAALSQGETLSFLVNDLAEPTRSIALEQGNVAMLMVPIVVAGQFWGVFGFDYCQAAPAPERDMAGIFAIAVDSIAAAIERQQKDEALRQSEQRYRTLFELSHEGIYRVEFERPISLSLPVEQQVELQYRYFRVVEANSAFAKLYGFDSPELAIGLKLTDLHVEDSEKNLAFMRALVENGGDIQNYESEELDRHGNRLYLLNNIISEIREGCIWGNWGTSIDITQLRQAQQALLQAEQERAQQLEASNQVLMLREKWLEATATAANALLSISDLDEAIDTALGLLGEGIGVDRVAVLQQIDDPSGSGFGHVKGLYEWDSPHASSQIDSEFQEIPWKGMEAWLVRLRAGEWVGGVVDEFAEPFRSGQIGLGVQSTYAVPIFVDVTLWGILAIDCCREKRLLTLPEVSVFKTAAACVGSAIGRDRLQRQREAVILDERSRMAREIHDTIAQGLTGVVVQLQAAEDNQIQNPSDRLFHIQTARQLAKTCLAEARRSVWALRPQALEDGDLSSAFSHLIYQTIANTGIPIQHQIQTAPYPIASAVENHLLRIAQEALTNILKHAQAERIWIQLTFEPTQIDLCIRDNGIGFEPEEVTHGFGLLGIGERPQQMQATLTLTSKPQQGTTIVVVVPVACEERLP